MSRPARGLGATGDPAVQPVLESALGDANEFVRGAAAHALRVHKAVREGNADEAARLESFAGKGQP